MGTKILSHFVRMALRKIPSRPKPTIRSDLKAVKKDPNPEDVVLFGTKPRWRIQFGRRALPKNFVTYCLKRLRAYLIHVSYVS